MPTPSRSALVLALAALAGCPSLSTRQTVDPVPPGRWQVGGGLDLVAAHDTHYDWQTGLPQLELTARRGLSADLDAGAKLYVGGLEAGVKWRFRHGRWAMAIAPALGTARITDNAVLSDAFYLFAHLPLIVGHPLSARWSMNVGPKLLYEQVWFRNGGDEAGLSLGAFVNFDWRFGACRRWHLVPELNLYRSVLGDQPLEGGALQAGVGLQVDLLIPAWAYALACLAVPALWGLVAQRAFAAAERRRLARAAATAAADRPDSDFSI